MDETIYPSFAPNVIAVIPAEWPGNEHINGKWSGLDFKSQIFTIWSLPPLPIYLHFVENVKQTTDAIQYYYQLL